MKLMDDIQYTVEIDRLLEFCNERNIKLIELEGPLEYSVVFYKYLNIVFVASNATAEHIKTFILCEFYNVKAVWSTGILEVMPETGKIESNWAAIEYLKGADINAETTR